MKWFLTASWLATCSPLLFFPTKHTWWQPRGWQTAQHKKESKKKNPSKCERGSALVSTLTEAKADWTLVLALGLIFNRRRNLSEGEAPKRSSQDSCVRSSLVHIHSSSSSSSSNSSSVCVCTSHTEDRIFSNVWKRKIEILSQLFKGCPSVTGGHSNPIHTRAESSEREREKKKKKKMTDWTVPRLIAYAISLTPIDI